MEPAPLPPHERSWRHPSELATVVAFDDTGGPSNRRAILLAGSTTVAVIALVLVATVSTGRSPAPFAVSATTVPMVRVEMERPSAGPAAAADDLRVWRTQTSAMTGSSVLAVAGAPNAISAAPLVDPDISSLTLAAALPGDDDVVLVLTESHTYRLSWRDIGDVVAPDDAVVITRDGALVAVFVSGELRLLVDA